MLLEERQLQSNCMTWFKEIKIHLETLLGRHMRPYENAFQIFFQEEYETFRVKMYHNLNQLQWQLEKENLYSCDPKTYLDVLITQFKEFFDSKRRNILWYLYVLDKLIDERVLKYGELQMKEREVNAIKEIEKRLKERKIQQQECLVIQGITLEANLSTDGTTLDASLVTEGATLEYSLVTKGISLDASNENRSFDNESSSSGNDADDDIGPSYDSDTVTEVHHSNNDTFENVFAGGIQNHEQPESIPDTYVVNENNSDIISDIPNMDQVRDKEEHDDVDDEQQRAFFASLINNLKCAIEKCMKVNHEAQQANALLTKSLRDIRKNKNILQRIRQLNLNTAKRLSF
ncbi:hypothetical protein Tco_0314026 [Tanacetum coccineum]